MMPWTRCDDGRERRAPRAPVALAAAAAAAVWLCAGRAGAEPGQGDPAIAAALFKAGRDLVDAGNYAAGCPKFEASFELSPSASTMIHVARCHEHDGKLVLAWDAYRRALALNAETRGAERRAKLEAVAKEGLEVLGPRLPKLRIVVDHPPPGLKVLRDGKELPAATLGEALPADPGQHEVSVSAPGYRSETRSAVLDEGKTVTVDVSLELVVTVATADAPRPPPKVAPDPPKAASAGPSPQRIAAYATGGVGIASLAIGSVLGGLVIGKRGEISAHCDPTFHCDAVGAAAGNSAKALALGSTIGVVAGIAGLGTATVLWLTDGSKKAPATGRAGMWVSAGALSADAKGAVFGLKGGF